MFLISEVRISAELRQKPSVYTDGGCVLVFVSIHVWALNGARLSACRPSANALPTLCQRSARLCRLHTPAAWSDWRAAESLSPRFVLWVGKKAAEKKINNFIKYWNNKKSSVKTCIQVYLEQREISSRQEYVRFNFPHFERSSLHKTPSPCIHIESGVYLSITLFVSFKWFHEKETMKRYRREKHENLFLKPERIRLKTILFSFYSLLCLLFTEEHKESESAVNSTSVQNTQLNRCFLCRFKDPNTADTYVTACVTQSLMCSVMLVEPGALNLRGSKCDLTNLRNEDDGKMCW